MLAVGSTHRIWRQNAGKFCVVPKPCRVCASKARWIEGAPTGAADLSGIAFGRRLEIEVKSATGRVSEDQQRWGRMIVERGGIYIVARSGAEAVEALAREA